MCDTITTLDLHHHLLTKLDCLSSQFDKVNESLKNQETKMADIIDSQAEFNELLTKLNADVTSHLAKDTKAEADLKGANELITSLKDQLSHAGMTDVQEAEVLAKLAELEAKLNPPVVTPPVVVPPPVDTPVDPPVTVTPPVVTPPVEEPPVVVPPFDAPPPSA